jgi:hypothetical protein
MTGTFIRYPDPQDSFRLFRHPEPGVDMNIAGRNHAVIHEKAQHALEAGCFIEALSLRLLYIEHWLKIYVFNVQPTGTVPKKMFGVLLDQCEKLAFDPVLVTRLRTFNDTRVNAIHHFLNGKTTYIQISGVLENSKDLSRLVARFVLQNSGQILRDEKFHEKWINGDAIWNTDYYLNTPNALPDV